MRPTRRRFALLAATGAMALSLTPLAVADGDGGGTRTYEVTITNLTSGQPLTPPVVATHHKQGQLFEVGQPASVGVREIAENGNLAPLLAFLDADPFDRISDVEAGTFPLVPDDKPGAPGVPPDPPAFPDSVTFEITASGNAHFLSFVSMLVCTNDGFTGVDSLRLPEGKGKTETADTQAYDSFTEQNTEDFAHIVPPCQGLIGVSSGEAGMEVSNPAIAEGGVIAHHEGIKDVADLDSSVHGWEDPVARIEVERID
jgi:spondin N